VCSLLLVISHLGDLQTKSSVTLQFRRSWRKWQA